MYLFVQEDFLSWLMDEAEGPEQETAAVAMRVLVVNLATIHTSSMVHSSLWDLSDH